MRALPCLDHLASHPVLRPDASSRRQLPRRRPRADPRCVRWRKSWVQRLTVNYRRRDIGLGSAHSGPRRRLARRRPETRLSGLAGTRSWTILGPLEAAPEPRRMTFAKFCQTAIGPAQPPLQSRPRSGRPICCSATTSTRPRAPARGGPERRCRGSPDVLVKETPAPPPFRRPRC